MITLESLMKTGDDLLERNVLAGSPDWQALHDETPDDIMPGEDDEDDLAETEATYFQADALRAALSADLQPLGEALAGALQAGDQPAMQAALRKISERMPEFMASPELEAVLATQFTEALTQEDPAP